MILFYLNKYKQNCVVYIWYYSLGISTGLGIIFLSPRGVSPFLAWVIFTRARVSLALLSLRKNGDYSQSSTGSTVGRLCWLGRLQQLFKWLDNDIQHCHFLNSSLWSWIAFLPIWLRPCWINIKFLKTSSPALETSSKSIQLTKRCKSEVINWLSSLTP